MGNRNEREIKRILGQGQFVEANHLILSFFFDLKNTNFYNFLQNMIFRGFFSFQGYLYRRVGVLRDFGSPTADKNMK